MFRNLIGFAILAVVALIALKFVMGLLGLAIGLFWTILWFAFIGFIFYLVLRVVSPGTADRIREMIKGKPAA